MHVLPIVYEQINLSTPTITVLYLMEGVNKEIVAISIKTYWGQILLVSMEFPGSLLNYKLLVLNCCEAHC